jgi:hypothetical protein
MWNPQITKEKTDRQRQITKRIISHKRIPFVSEYCVSSTEN